MLLTTGMKTKKKERKKEKEEKKPLLHSTESLLFAVAHAESAFVRYSVCACARRTCQRNVIYSSHPFDVRRVNLTTAGLLVCRVLPFFRCSHARHRRYFFY